MRRPRTVEITNHSVVIAGLDVSNMIHAVDLHLDADSLPTVTIHSIPDVISFKGTALVDDPRLPRGDGIERLRRRLAGHKISSPESPEEVATG